MAGNGYKHYKQTAITTATPGQVLIMLYEGAIQHLRKAAEAMDRKDVAAKCRHIGKAHDIVNELCATLNHEVGGDIARDLERLYNYMGSQLVKANMENNKESVLQVAKLLETLLSGWKGAVEQVQRGQTK